MSPWLLGYSHHEAATANAAFVGLALALGSHFEVSCCLSAEWLHALVGAWLVAAPFLFGYGSTALATANSIAVGVLVLMLAISASPLEKEIERLIHRRAADR
jgi:hypothetical protein